MCEHTTEVLPLVVSMELVPPNDHLTKTIQINFFIRHKNGRILSTMLVGAYQFRPFTRNKLVKLPSTHHEMCFKILLHDIPKCISCLKITALRTYSIYNTNFAAIIPQESLYPPLPMHENDLMKSCARLITTNDAR